MRSCLPFFFSFNRKALVLDAGAVVGFGHREKENQGAGRGAAYCAARKAEVKESPSASVCTWRSCPSPFLCHCTEGPLLMAVPACIRVRSSLCADVPMLKGTGGRGAASLPSQKVLSSRQGTASPRHLLHLLRDPPSRGSEAGMRWAVLELRSHGCCKLRTSSCVWGTHWCCWTTSEMCFICSSLQRAHGFSVLVTCCRWPLAEVTENWVTSGHI